MKFDRKSLLLYAITDRTWLNGRTLFHDVECALKGGVSMVQLREKNLDYSSFLNEAIIIKSLCKKYNVPFIINDNVDIAISCNADGIHVGQNDLNVKTVREKVGNNMIIGVSAQTVEQAKLAERDGADYLGVGAMFSTTTKLDADNVSIETLKSITNVVSIPVCAIGGITEKNMSFLKDTGICGVSLISAIFSKENIEKTSRDLKNQAYDLFKQEI